jgi:hypothetical protein
MSKIKTLITSFLISVLVTLGAVAAAGNEKFVPGVSDLPVPTNFYLKHDSSSIFHEEEGRIIDASFIGRATESEVEEFYNLTLRALGWKRVEKLVYIRESEILRIEVQEIDDSQLNNLEINFSLRPQ